MGECLYFRIDVKKTEAGVWAVRKKYQPHPYMTSFMVLDAWHLRHSICKLSLSYGEPSYSCDGVIWSQCRSCGSYGSTPHAAHTPPSLCNTYARTFFQRWVRLYGSLWFTYLLRLLYFDFNERIRVCYIGAFIILWLLGSAFRGAALCAIQMGTEVKHCEPHL